MALEQAVEELREDKLEAAPKGVHALRVKLEAAPKGELVKGTGSGGAESKLEAAPKGELVKGTGSAGTERNTAR